MSAKRMVASILILLARMILLNISSQNVHVLGFILLGRIPKARKGTDAGPRNGTGKWICCQQPLQILDWVSTPVPLR